MRVDLSDKETAMRKIIFPALIVGLLAGCYTVSEKEWVAQMNADKRVWPPVVEGQPFPVQFMWDKH